LAESGDELPQVTLVAVTPPGVGPEGDIVAGELCDVEDGTVVRLVKHDGYLPATVVTVFLEEDDIEWCACYAISVMVDADSLEFHGAIPFSLWGGPSGPPG
jgi:hypothetical protein